jgi:hypothetical protein
MSNTSETPPLYERIRRDRKARMDQVEPLLAVRSRVAGSRLPAGALNVTRPSKWSNPWRVVADGWFWDVQHVLDRASMGRFEDKIAASRWAVMAFHRDLSQELQDSLPDLSGRVLACWCPIYRDNGLPYPCHRTYLALRANYGAVVDPWQHVEAVTAQ